MKSSHKHLSLISRSLGCLLALACGLANGFAQETVPLFHSPLFADAVKPVVALPDGHPDTQILAEIVVARQAAIRTALTLANKEGLLKEIGAAEFEELENFVAARPQSPWTPSLRVVLGKYHRDRGSYTRALEHWETAWEATKLSTSRSGQEIADAALAHWTRLLASLGRGERLTELFTENRDRRFSVGWYAQMWVRTREGHAQMHRTPGIAYKCGVHALNNLAFALYGTNVQAIVQAASPVGGFSLGQLWSYSDAHQLALAPAVRERGDQIVVPSLVHWRQNHYAAIIAKHGERYEVIDPTFGEERQMMDAQTLDAEASGYFMIPANALPSGWSWLSRAEAAQVFGRGCPYGVCDYSDQRCPETCPPSCPTGLGGGPPPGGPPPGGPPPGGPPPGPPPSPQTKSGAGCTSCSGNSAGAWAVSEPYINLWLYTAPLERNSSHGPNPDFKLSFKQRNDAPVLSGYSFVGAGWNGNWLTYIDARYLIGGPYSGPGTIYLPGGGVTYFQVNASESVTPGNYYNNLRLKTLRDENGSPTGFELLYPDGSKLVYGYRNAQFLYDYFFLTAIVDPQGRQLALEYATDDYAYLHLDTVTEPDGYTTTLYYDNATS
jgi:hypothetical protein